MDGVRGLFGEELVFLSVPSPSRNHAEACRARLPGTSPSLYVCHRDSRDVRLSRPSPPSPPSLPHPANCRNFPLANFVFCYCGTKPENQMPEVFMEKDVCALVLAVDVRVDQMIFEERGAERLFLAGEQQRSRRVASRPLLAGSAGVQEVDTKVEVGVFAPSEATETDHASVGAVDLVPAGIHGQTMADMLRLGEYFGR